MADQELPQIISREQAREVGLKRFFTGIPCKRGHICERHGKRGECVSCKKELKRRYYRKYKSKICKKLKDQYWEDPVSTRKKRNDYADKKRDLIRRLNKQSRIKYPEIVRQWKRNRKAKIRGSTGIVSAKLVSDLMVSQRNSCVYCNCKISETPKFKERKAHLDHKMPICLGGKHSIENLQWLCEPCNIAKGGMHPEEWAKKNGLLL